MRPTPRARSRRRFLCSSLGLAGLALLGGCGAVPPQTPRSKRIPRLGFLASDAPPPTPAQQAFFQALHDLGHVDGQTIAVQYRWAEAREERLPSLAAELVALDVDVIYAFSTTPAQAAKAATGTIPIVFGVAPIRSGPGWSPAWRARVGT